MPHCGLETLLIQARSECVTLCIGELTRVCTYPPKFFLKSQDRFSMEIIIGRLANGNQEQKQDRSFEIADNRLSSPDRATIWRGAI